MHAEQVQQRQLSGSAEIDRSVGFRQPQLHPVRLQDRCQLLAMEGALVLADDDRVEATLGIGYRRE